MIGYRHRMRNWAGNLEYRSSALAEPANLDDLLELAAIVPHLQALGSRHSFSTVADTEGLHISTAGLGIEIDVDETARCVRVPAHARYGDVASVIAPRGWALANLASLPHISVAGSVATGTHGSGDHNGTLATSVRSLDLVTSRGEQVTLRRGDADFDGAVVSLGALGIVTALELDLEPGFVIRQDVIDGASRAQVADHFDEVFASAYSVSMFTSLNPDGLAQLWVKQREASDLSTLEALSGGSRADGARNPVPGQDPRNSTEQGTWGPWHQRLPHFRLDFTPSNGHELQTEYLLPRARAREALAALEDLAPLLSPLLMICEVRTMRADDLWLSGAFGRDTIGLHFTWHPAPAVADILPRLEESLGTLGGRPHWGKVFTAQSSDITSRYPRWADFTSLRARLDPRNAFLGPFTNALGLHTLEA